MECSPGVGGLAGRYLTKRQGWKWERWGLLYVDEDRGCVCGGLEEEAIHHLPFRYRHAWSQKSTCRDSTRQRMPDRDIAPIPGVLDAGISSIAEQAAAGLSVWHVVCGLQLRGGGMCLFRLFLWLR